MSDVEKGGLIAKVIGPKRRWREYKARVRQLPPDYRAAAEAVQRYSMHFVPIDSDTNASMFEDLAGLFERAAAEGTPIREIVGPDPVTFAQAFVQNYSQGGYVPARERKRLADAIARAAGEGTGTKAGVV